MSGPVPDAGVGQADRRAGGPGSAEREFDSFAREQRRALVAFAWTLTGDVGAAEEVAQDALHATWQAWERDGGLRRPDAWARQVVANRAADRVRRAGRERRALGVVGARPDPTVDLPTTDHEFWDAVRALPGRQAQAIALHYLEDRSVAEIAEVLGCAAATVKVHLHRGRRALADALAPETDTGKGER
ncbi:MAG TPA: sigma-70 family RNA polymerase sigma factor [Acidimicrobiales bacterium]